MGLSVSRSGHTCNYNFKLWVWPHVLPDLSIISIIRPNNELLLLLDQIEAILVTIWHRMNLNYLMQKCESSQLENSLIPKGFIQAKALWVLYFLHLYYEHAHVKTLCLSQFFKNKILFNHSHSLILSFLYF